MSQDGEQMSISDLGLWFGRTSPEHCPQMTERTSESFLKRPQESWNRPPLFLDMRGGGLIAESFWDESGLSLGEYTTCSFGERPSSTAIREMYSNWGLRSVVVESRLSQILEDRPLPDYSLSPRACQGILNRAKKRGKELPKLLEETLIRQSRFKNEQVVTGGKGLLIQQERTGALSTLNNQAVLSRTDLLSRRFDNECHKSEST